MSASISDETMAEGPLASGARIGSYLIDRRLGAGGMGTVYAARHTGLDKPVVIKALNPMLAGRPEAVMRFVREGRAASKIRHPHVVDVTDVGTHEGIPFLVMELLEGEDLESRLEACRRFTDAEIARIMLPVCDAVATAHELGVIHRDLKPGNIFLARGSRGRETPMVLDFGLAKIFDEERKVDRHSITRTATFLGTPYYVSPEQAQSGALADAQSDQYSLGAIIYELATSKRHVLGGNPYEVLCAIIANQTVPIRTARSDVSPELEALVTTAMEHDKRKRFTSVRELGRALLGVADPGVRSQWAAAFGATGATPARPIEVADVRRPNAYAATMQAPALNSTGPLLAAPPSQAPVLAPPAYATGPLVPGPSPIASQPGYQSFTSQPGFATGPLEPSGLTATRVSLPGPNVPVAQPKKSSVGLLVAITVALLAGLVLGPAGYWWFALRETRPTEPPPPFTIAVAPESAAIELDGRPAGTGSVEVARDGRAHRIRVSAPGHVAQELRLGAGDRPPRTITLRAEPPPPVVAPPPPVVALVPEPPPVVAEEPVPPPQVVAPPPLQPQRPQPQRQQPRPTPTINPWGSNQPVSRPAPVYQQPTVLGHGNNNSPVIR